MSVKYTTAGESHGRSLISIIEGIPAGITISTDQIREELAKRRGGVGRGERQKFEKDEVTIISGVIQGKTIASPIAIEIKNSEWGKWDQIMSPDFIPNVNQEQPNMPNGEESDKLVTPRPGHADLPGIVKYGFANARPVLERASARETAARVAAGSIAKAFIKQAFGIEISAKVVQFGQIIRNINENDEDFDSKAKEYADKSLNDRQTVGGVVEVTANNVPIGLGSYISADQRLDSAIAGALMGIQAVKGVEIGDGFGIAAIDGSAAHDYIYSDGSANQIRKTNHAGGIEGGISNGEPIVVRIAIKPIPSVPGGLPTVNLQMNTQATAHSQRSDISAVYPARVVAEAELAVVLADFITKRFGGDCLEKMRFV